MNSTLNSNLTDKQDKIDSNLHTTDKSIVGAINKLLHNVSISGSIQQIVFDENLTDGDFSIFAWINSTTVILVRFNTVSGVGFFASTDGGVNYHQYWNNITSSK